jgi:hydroxypyruvate reductase
MQPRRILLELFDAALRAVHGRDAVARALREHGGPVTIMAVGKAASSMALGAHDALGAAIQETLVITKDGHADPGLAQLPRVTVMESAHPVPDSRSLAAGAELERRLARLDAHTHPVFLVSGGSSSLVESLRAGRSLADLRALNEQGLAAGLDIAALNARRGALSRLKHGGVARLLAGRRATALFISDVPGDDPGIIGSGLLGRDGAAADGILRIVVASLEMAVGRVAQAAQACGLSLDSRASRFDGAAEEVAHAFVDALRATAADGLVWGGESTVRLPARFGRGGRNSHLALVAARLLRAQEGITILAAGTDGTDGSSSDAGALVDGGTLERAELAGCDVERAFHDFDSATALECAEDLVHTGPTGTNVGDLLIGIKQPANPLRGLDLPRML